MNCKRNTCISGGLTRILYDIRRWGAYIHLVAGQQMQVPEHSFTTNPVAVGQRGGELRGPRSLGDQPRWDSASTVAAVRGGSSDNLRSDLQRNLAPGSGGRKNNSKSVQLIEPID
jgi:hypothetical protein